jgi:hypothetical protein
MGMRGPLWTTHFASGDVRVVETDGRTIRVIARGGQMEVGYEIAERIAREILGVIQRRERADREQMASIVNKRSRP